MSGPLVLGIDIGGTSTRAVLADLDGNRVGNGSAPGANPTSHDPATAATRVATAATAALGGADPARVVAAVLGMAGGGRLARSPVRAAFDRAWCGTGLRCGYRVVGDAEVGYAAGTAAPTGTVLIAGTGAIAAQVRDFRLERVADGHGWLLGDEGSGFWLGREAVRLALSELDSQRPLRPLAARVVATVLDETAAGAPATGRSPREISVAMINRIAEGPPVGLAALAPLVLEHCCGGDPAATRLVRTAARLLAGTVAVVRPPGDTTPIVLAGGLLTSTNPLAAAVAHRLALAWPDAPRSRAADTAGAAAWLALRGLPDEHPASALPNLDETVLARLHARMIISAPASAPAAGPSRGTADLLADGEALADLRQSREDFAAGDTFPMDEVRGELERRRGGTH